MIRVRTRKRQRKRILCALNTKAGFITYYLSRSYKRRTMEISVDDSLKVHVAAPSYVEEGEIIKFIHDKATWIQRKLNKAQRDQSILDQRRYRSGHEFLFLGSKYRLAVLKDNIRQSRIAFDGQRWEIKVPSLEDEEMLESRVKEKLVQWYRDQAREILGGRIFHFTRITGLQPSKIAVRSQKRIWGSCDYRGKSVSLNWQLVLSPLEVIDYVVVHELCHLVVPNHSQRFWKKVEKVLPDYKMRKEWLKAHALDMILP